MSSNFPEIARICQAIFSTHSSVGRPHLCGDHEVSKEAKEKEKHTAPERRQPKKFATLSFSAFLVDCDQEKKLQVGQQIL